MSSTANDDRNAFADWGPFIRYPQHGRCYDDRDHQDDRDHPPHVLPFYLDRWDYDYVFHDKDSLPSNEVFLSLRQPNFTDSNNDNNEVKTEEQMFWDGLERVAHLVATLTPRKLYLRHWMSDGSPVAFAGDLRCEATMLRQARQLVSLEWDFSGFPQLSNMEALTAALSHHPCLERIELWDKNRTIPILEEVESDAHALSNAILSLPKLREFNFPELLDSDQLGALIERKNIKELQVPLMNLIASDAFFRELANPSKNVSLKKLRVMDTLHSVEPVDHSLFARKMSLALETNRSLQALFWERDINATWHRNAQESSPSAFLQRQEHHEAGYLMGKALAQHPGILSLSLHFDWHDTFFLQILTGVSTSQSLQDITLDCFTGKPEPCESLVQVLEHSNLQSLTVAGLEDLDTFFNALRVCTTTRLRTLCLHGPTLSGQVWMKHICQLLDCSLPSLETLHVHTRGSPCMFLDVIAFLWAVKEFNLSALSVDLSVQCPDEEICATKFLYAVKSSFRWTELNISGVNGHGAIMSPYTIAVCRGILAMNRAGRRYICSESANRGIGITVLAAVADNVDCLFLHLQENLSLCSNLGRPGLAGRRR